MPSWLSSSHGNRKSLHGDASATVENLSPPINYEDWAQLIEAIVRHFNQKLKLDVRYKIWWEPDTEYWQGSEEEYFTLYRYAAFDLYEVIFGTWKKFGTNSCFFSRHLAISASLPILMPAKMPSGLA